VERWATFDCYGTLIDWESGIGAAFRQLWPHADVQRLLRRYHQIEPNVQQDGAISYRGVLRLTLAGVAASEALSVPEGNEDALADSLPSWPAFPEVRSALGELRKRGWKLAILSNTDPDLLAASVGTIGVEIDLLITAAEAGSYKPAHGHWLAFREVAHPEPGRQVHVAASPFHDLAPASELGIPAVWINRAGESAEPARSAELPDLSRLADTLDRLVRP
jgi:2-haloacid dehalogenase